MRIIKFGGTSIGTPERFANAIEIIRNKHAAESAVVVLSAIEGTTDALLKAISVASSGGNDYRIIIDELKTIHGKFLNSLVSDEYAEETSSYIDMLFSRILVQLQGVFLLKECTNKTSDSIVSCGEYLSCRILEGALKSAGLKSSFYEAAEFIKTDSNFGDAFVNFSKTDVLIEKRFADKPRATIAIVNGFTGSDDAGSVTTLGRSGSDFTATIIGAALKCSAVEIWTDVNGVLTADPKIIGDAVTLSEISYEDISKISILGARVIHSKAMEPAERAGIPVLILNSFNPSHPGTLINKDIRYSAGQVVSITYLDGQSLISTNGFARKNSHILLSRLFAVLSRHNISVSLGGQSSYDSSYYFATDSVSAGEFLPNVRKEFALELSHGGIGEFSVRNNVAVISIIVSKFGAQNIFGKTFEVLFENGIVHHLLLNGPGGEVVSFVVDSDEVSKTISALHEAFFKKEASADVA